MEGLQRSTSTFRRSGSSGLVWDERFLSGELKQNQNKEEEKENGRSKELRAVNQSLPPVNCSRARDVPTGEDPPSPRIGGCCFCEVFKHGDSNKRRRTRRRNC
ncbi:hypothetical protein LUZ60_009678 [Juncus effusus]|nr:hypothetical protein LUZ60_009678 [Juncus effusus]